MGVSSAWYLHAGLMSEGSVLVVQQPGFSKGRFRIQDTGFRVLVQGLGCRV